MSDCACVYVDIGDAMPEFFKARNRLAIKEHKCCECRRIIKPPEGYEYASGKWEGDFFNI